MNISADHGSGSTHGDDRHPHIVLKINDYRLEDSALRALAHSLGLTPIFCPKIPLDFEEHLFNQLCAPKETWTPFCDFIDRRRDETRRIALRTLLEQDYQEGVRGQFRASTSSPSAQGRHAVLASVAPKFAHGTTPPELMSLIKGSDLHRVVLPVIDTFINDTDGYLTKRIPPHVGHGHSRMLAMAKPEVVKAETEAEARQDRASAADLLRKLKNFLISGEPQDFTLLMRKFNTCGDWLDWLRTPPEEGATHPEAEQVLANTIIRLLKFKEFTRTYEDEFMTQGTCERFVRWQWSEPCALTKRIDPLAYPLLASCLDLLTRDDFRHL